jgi:hypothetical protein
MRHRKRDKPGCCGEPEQQNFHVDAYHFQPYVNSEMGNVFLNQICGFDDVNLKV